MTSFVSSRVIALCKRTPCKNVDVQLTAFTHHFRKASSSTASQPKSIALSGDGAVFIAEANDVEVFKSNQKLFDLKPKFSPSSVAASGSLIAVGGEVSEFTCTENHVLICEPNS